MSEHWLAALRAKMDSTPQERIDETPADAEATNGAFASTSSRGATKPAETGRAPDTLRFDSGENAR